MENFSLFNLLRALGGADGDSASGDGTKNTGGESREKHGAPHAESAEDKGAGANVLAAVLERHERVSNRIKNRAQPKR